METLRVTFARHQQRRRPRRINTTPRRRRGAKM
jgi:hypothetical protein